MRELIILISVFFLVGCGGGSGSDTITTAPVESLPDDTAPVESLPDGTEKMIVGQTYQVSHGDQVLKTTENAQIKVNHVDGKTNSTIELVAGEANIVRSQ